MPIHAFRISNDFELTAAVVQACAWAEQLEHDDHAPWMAILLGAPGVGKTSAAQIAALLHFERPHFVTAPEFARWPRYGSERSALFERVKDFGHGEPGGVLILDDIGREVLDASGSTEADVEELVDMIYRFECPTIATTNATTKQLEKRYGARVRDRLSEMARWLPIVGPSMRKAHDDAST